MLVVVLPDRDEERAGVIRTIFMNEALIHRPTSGASAQELAAQLGDARSSTRRLTDDLSTQQLMGPMLPIVNPILWEIGHVGWFHEYWTLRHAHGATPILARADALWNSSTVAHATRWDLDLPDRGGVFGYMADVLSRQVDRLAGGVDLRARYFYDLAIRHEDMHVEALAYTRQTLSYARPQALGSPARQRAGAWGDDVDVLGGQWQLGSKPADGFVFDNQKWAHAVSIPPCRIAKARVTRAELGGLGEGGGYQRREFWGMPGWEWRARAGAEHPAYWLNNEGDSWTWRNHDKVEALPPHAPVAFVNWYEAQAYCNWAERRLPPEAEWEAAAVGEPSATGLRLANVKRRWPWGEAAPSAGRANLGFSFDGPLDVAACAAGDSAFGCRQMIGN